MRPNDLAFSCRERATTSVSKTERSRARSGQLQCRVGRDRRVDPFPLRSIEACAASQKEPTHQACAATPQASETVPRAYAATQKESSDQASDRVPQASAVRLNWPTDQASDWAPQA